MSGDPLVGDPFPARAATAPILPLHASAPATAPGSSTAATAAPRVPETDGFRSSGQSPGAATLHLVGPGRVGQAFLRDLCDLPVRLVAVSDSAATVFDRHGLDAAALADWKAAGHPLRDLPRSEAISTEVAVAVVAADVVVDATPTAAAGTEAAVARVRAALRTGAFVALCGKNALAAAAAEWLTGAHRGRVGIHAVLGGTGRQLVRELPELREHCRQLCLCGNATTTTIIQAIEQGASLAEGIAIAGARGLLEADPTLDFDGSDAATKLLAVHGAVFGESWLAPRRLADVLREDVRSLDPTVVRERARHGATTRLLARAGRDGRLQVTFEAVPPGSPFAAPADRVVYGYELADGWRVHTGVGLGHGPTAAALREDVVAALGAEVRQ